MSMTNLLPCPFCGREARISHSGDGELCNIRCVGWNPGDCLGAGPNCHSAEEAVDSWNRRTATAAAIPDERAVFESWARSYGTWEVKRDDDPALDTTGYTDVTLTVAWHAIQARAALVATPAAVQTHAEVAAALGINSALTRIRAGNHAEAIAPLEHALRVLAATPAAAAQVVLPEPDAWRDGARFALEAVSKVGSICWLTDSMRVICIKQAADAVIAERDRQRALLAQQPAIMPKGESAAAQLRAMATNYPAGHSWDKLDAKACIRGALEIEALRALLGVSAPAAQAVEPTDEQLFKLWQSLPAQGDPTGQRFAIVFARAALALQATHSAPQAQADALDAVKQAVRDYHFALDTRQHGGVAAGQALDAIQGALDMHWKQGKLAARAAQQKHGGV